MQQKTLPSVVQELLLSSERPNLRLSSALRQTSRAGAEQWEHNGKYELPPLRYQSQEQVQNACFRPEHLRQSAEPCSPSSWTTSSDLSRSCTPATSAGSTTAGSSACCVREGLEMPPPTRSSESAFITAESSYGSCSLAHMPLRQTRQQQLPSLPQPTELDYPDRRVARTIQDTDAYRIICEYTREWTRDELYAALFQASSSATYGERRVHVKPQERKPEPMRANYPSSPRFQTALKTWQSSGSHGAKEKERRTRHRQLQSLLHSMVCELADKLAQQDPVLVNARKNNGKGTSSAKVPGKDDQFVSNVYHIVFSRLVAQSEHEGRLSAEAIVRRYRQKFGDLPDDRQETVTYSCASHGSPYKRCKTDESSRKRVKLSHSAPSSRSSYMGSSSSPSPSVSFTSRSMDDTFSIGG